MKKPLYALLALGMVACGKKDSSTLGPNELMKNDFESLDGWVGNEPLNVPSLSKEKAHSGRYSLKVGPEVEYSMGYNALLGKLSPSKLKKIKLKGWAYLPKAGANATLVAVITDPTKPGAEPIKWEGLNIGNDVKTFGKWVEVEKIVDIPDNASYANRFNIYLWRTQTLEPVYFDDLSVEKVD